MKGLTAILLAAGCSTRMNDANKLLLPFGGSTVVRHCYEQLNASKTDRVVVVVGMDFERVRRQVQLGENHEVVFNPDYAKGMTTSIQSGIKAASGARGYMICLGDMPMLKTADYNQMIDAFEEVFSKDPRCILVPRTGQKKGNPVIFSGSYERIILEHDAMEGCRQIISENPDHVVGVDTINRAFFCDMDTPEDYKRLKDAFK